MCCFVEIVTMHQTSMNAQLVIVFMWRSVVLVERRQSKSSRLLK